MLFGLPIQAYGIILSLAMLVGWGLVILKAKQSHRPVEDLETVGFYAILAGIVGARVWHVLTDWSLYQDNILNAIKIWQGGLSIVGAIIGGVLGLMIWKKLTKPSSLSVTQVLDLSVFGLPIAQAIGRWGNYINQELYGLPTTLPWGVYIEPQHRLAEFSSSSHFHPLFFYEGAATLAFGIWIWWFDSRGSHPLFVIGKGNYFWLYILYYALIRFFLDFIRPDKRYLFTTGVGINQVVLLVVMMIASSQLIRSWKKLKAQT